MREILPLRRWRGQPGIPPGRAGRRFALSSIAMALLPAAITMSGCLLPTVRPRAAFPSGEIPPVYEGQSLRSIGEQALVAAEEAADAGWIETSQILYRRAVWAFEYHWLLTLEEPPLLEAARKGQAEASRGEKGEIP